MEVRAAGVKISAGKRILIRVRERNPRSASFRSIGKMGARLSHRLIFLAKLRRMPLLLTMAFLCASLSFPAHGQSLTSYAFQQNTQSSAQPQNAKKKKKKDKHSQGKKKQASAVQPI